MRTDKGGDVRLLNQGLTDAGLLKNILIQRRIFVLVSSWCFLLQFTMWGFLHLNVTFP